MAQDRRTGQHASGRKIALDLDQAATGLDIDPTPGPDGRLQVRVDDVPLFKSKRGHQYQLPNVGL